MNNDGVISRDEWNKRASDSVPKKVIESHKHFVDYMAHDILYSPTPRTSNMSPIPIKPDYTVTEIKPIPSEPAKTVTEPTKTVTEPRARQSIGSRLLGSAGTQARGGFGAEGNDSLNARGGERLRRA